MASELTAQNQDRALSNGERMHAAGQAANHAASRHVFGIYKDGKAQNTLRGHENALVLFGEYLKDIAGLETGDLFNDPAAWAGVTWGLVQGFVQWQIDRGYAVGAVNVRLSAVRTYAGLAAKAGTLDREEYQMIQGVRGYRHSEGKHLDEKRTNAGTPTRIGDKKAEPTKITPTHAECLKAAHEDSPQGRRDRLIMCLLLDWGMRVSELVDLTVDDFTLDLCATLHVYRRKVDNESMFDLTSTPDTLAAVRAYFDQDAPESGPVFRSSSKTGALLDGRMTTRSMSKRVRVLGQRCGIERLSPHDLRHHAATVYGATHTTRQLMDIFGWSSPAMAVRYQAAAELVRVQHL